MSNAVEKLNSMKTEYEHCQWIWQDGSSDFNKSSFREVGTKAWLQCVAALEMCHLDLWLQGA